MDWLPRWARDTPDAPFLISGDEVIDFREADRRVSSLASSLRQEYPEASRLGVVMRPDLQTVLAALAVPVAGLTLVPLPAAGPDEARRVLASVADAVVDPVAVTPDSSSLRIAPEPHWVRSAIFTSGSTGAPRAVRLTWQNIEASAAASAAHLDHRPHDRWLAVLPLHHVGGLSILWRAERQGSAVVLAGGFDPDVVVRLLQRGEVTLASFVSPMVERLVEAGLEAAPGFRLGLVGGGPVSPRALSASGLRLLPTYGMTETASQVATADPTDPRPDRLVVLDGAEVSIGDDGRIIVGGPMVSPGYLDGEDITGPLVTGDMGRLHGARLEVLGRADTVIVTGGENVIPERVETVLSRLPGAGSVVVVGVSDSRWGAVVAAAYTGPGDAAALEAGARRMLPSHEVPRRWRRVAELPTVGVGKIDRAAVATLFD